jgi:hypothetical protein
MAASHVLEAAVASATIVGAVCALPAVRLRRGNTNRRLRDLAKVVTLAVVLAFAPATQATAAQPATQPRADAPQRHTVISAPDVELQALSDTLNFDERLFTRRDDTVHAVAPHDGPRSAAEAELDALTGAVAENAARGVFNGAPAWNDGFGGHVPAAEAELHALLASPAEQGAASRPTKPMDVDFARPGTEAGAGENAASGDRFSSITSHSGE